MLDEITCEKCGEVIDTEEVLETYGDLEEALEAAFGVCQSCQGEKQ